MYLKLRFINYNVKLNIEWGFYFNDLAYCLIPFFNIKVDISLLLIKFEVPVVKINGILISGPKRFCSCTLLQKNTNSPCPLKVVNKCFVHKVIELLRLETTVKPPDIYDASQVRNCWCNFWLQSCFEEWDPNWTEPSENFFNLSYAWTPYGHSHFDERKKKTKCEIFSRK
jgi:hypothetical protein